MPQVSKNSAFLAAKVFSAVLLMTPCAFTQAQKNEEIKPDRAVEQTIAGDQIHQYQVNLKANQLFQIRVEQKSADVAIRLFDSNNRLLVEQNDLARPGGIEELLYLVKNPGKYEFQISVPMAGAAGKYVIQWTAKTADKEAHARIDFARARKINSEAWRLYSKGTIDSLRNAVGRFTEAINLFHSVQDKDNKAISLEGLAGAYKLLNESGKAIESLQEALRHWQEARELTHQARILNSLGSIHSVLGDDQKAFEYFLKGLELNQKIGNKRGEQILILNLSELLDRNSFNKQDEALNYLKKNLDTSLQNKDNLMAAISSGKLGLIHSKLKDKVAAEHYFGQALSYAESYAAFSKQPIWKAIIERNIGKGYVLLDEDQKAIEFFLKSLGDFQAAGIKNSEPYIFSDISGSYLKLKDNQNALDFAEKALAAFQFTEDKSGKAKLLGDLMNLWNKNNNVRIGIFYGKQSVNLFQELRQSIQRLDKQTQAAYLKTVQPVYQQLAELLISEGRFAEAQQVLSLLKEEEYFDYVRRDANEIKKLKDKVGLKPDEQKLIERYKLLADDITAVGAEFQKLDDKKRKLPAGVSLSPEEQKLYDDLSSKLRDANRAFKLFLEKELIAEFGKAKKEEVDRDVALQGKLRQWGDGTVALYTIAGADRYRVILTTPTVQIDGKTEIKSSELNKKIFAFREALQNPSVDPRPLGKELYDILIKPIERDLNAAGARTLLWSLDGTLRYVPIAALSPDGTTYLVEKYQNAVITSTTRQGIMAETEKDWKALGVGVSQPQTVADPAVPDEKISFVPLPSVRTELAAIVKDEQLAEESGLLPGKRFVDADFNQKNFSDYLTKETAEGKRRYTVVHIASHFRLGDNSANSFLLLGDGSILTLEQFSSSSEMTFENVELVTLSACNTAFAGGADSTGKEVDSLATFIELKGARSILATLWSVADESTGLLMGEFYRARKENPALTKAEAMQKAQIAMVRGAIRQSGKSAPQDASKENRSDVLDLSGKKTNNPVFKKTPDAPFAHPFYWSPFVLIGNWR